MSQTHSDFKVFVATPSPNGLFPAELYNAVEEFTKDGSICPKSVGVEYVEKHDKLVLSIGYRTDEPGFQAQVECVSLGKLDLVPDVIDAALSKAAKNTPNVICHEFYVTGTGDFFVVFLSQR